MATVRLVCDDVRIGYETDRSATPVVHRMHLGEVVLPVAHPRAAEGSCPIFSFAISGPDGHIVVDTGPDVGHPIIDELYAPSVISIVSALNREGLDERDVIGVVNTHLHFDHCGQNHRLDSAPVWVTAEELEAAKANFYTVPDWARIEPGRRRISADEEEIGPGIRLLHTPGHTPGHQSVSVQSADGLQVIVGQACYDCSEFRLAEPAETDMHEPDWLTVGRRSLERLVGLRPDVAHFSHDPAVYHRRV